MVPILPESWVIEPEKSKFKLVSANLELVVAGSLEPLGYISDLFPPHPLPYTWCSPPRMIPGRHDLGVAYIESFPFPYQEEGLQGRHILMIPV